MTAWPRSSSRASRRVVRNRLLVAGLLPLVLVLMFGLKVVLMLANSSGGRSALEAGESAQALSAYAANDTLNVLEPWIAPYDEGVARYGLEDYAGAVEVFTRALDDVPTAQECTVRINLALSREALGDVAAEAGRADEAAAEFAEGSRVLVAGGCPLDPELGQDEPDEQEQDEQPTRQEQQQLAQAQQIDGRLREKRQQQQRDDPAQEPSDTTPKDQQQEQDEPDPQKKKLDERNAEGQEERRRVEEFQDNEGAGPDYQW